MNPCLCLIPAVLAITAVSCKTSSGNYRHRAQISERDTARSILDDTSLEALPVDMEPKKAEAVKVEESGEKAASAGETVKEDFFQVHFKRIFMGDDFACGVSKVGVRAGDMVSVYCWGSNVLGQVGLDSSVRARYFPYRVINQVDLSAVGVGSTSACGVERATGDVSCWGGRSPLDTSTNGFGTVKTMQPITEATFMVADTHRCAGQFRYVNVNDVLTPETRLQCWGTNHVAQFGNGASTTEITSAAAEVKIDIGRIYALESTSTGTCALTNADVTPTSTKKPDKVYCWGNNSNLQLVPNSTLPMLTNPTEVIGVTGELSQLKSRGQIQCVMVGGTDLTCWGQNIFNVISESNTAMFLPPTPIKLPFKIKTYALGSANICVVSDTGEVHCWGLNTKGQMGTGRAIPDAVKLSQAARIPLPMPAVDVAVNNQGGCALFANDRASCWGDNSMGIIGSGLALPGVFAPTPVYQDFPR